MMKEVNRPDEFSYIGGSKAATIMGANKYETPVELWRKFLGLTEPDEFNEAMRIGQDLEDYAKSRFVEKTGREVIDAPFRRMKGADHVGGHADGELVDEPAVVPLKELLEIKTTVTDNYAKEDLPPYVAYQMQHYLMVYEADICHLWVFEMHRQSWKHFVIMADTDLQRAMLEAYDEFWECVQSKEPPTALRSSDHILLNPTPVEGTVTGGDSTEEQISELEEVKAEISGLEEKKRFLEEQLKMQMGGYNRMETDGFRVTWSPCTRAGFDTARFKSTHPELYSAFSKESTFRKFQIRRRNNV